MDFRALIKGIKNGEGRAVRNEWKRLSKHPDLRGHFRIPESKTPLRAGQLMELVGWVRRAVWHKPTMWFRVEVVEDEDAYIAGQEERFRVRQELRDIARGCATATDEQVKDFKDEREEEEPEGEL